MLNWVKLPGASELVSAPPTKCSGCGGTHFYSQNDFKRGVGLWLVSLASVMTVVLAALGFNWWLIWSPMLVALLVDRFFFYASPIVVLCYRCGRIHRGLTRSQAESVAPFDLELSDRLLYSERQL